MFDVDAGQVNSFHAVCWTHSRDAIVVVDSSSTSLVAVNPAAEKLTGYTAGELLGNSFLMLHPAAERDKVECGFYRDIATSGIRKDLQLIRKDGTILPVEISYSFVEQSPGAMLSIATIRDITEQQRTEAHLAAKSWALSALTRTVLALGCSNSAEELLQAVCDAITQESSYLMACACVAQDLPGKPVLILGRSGCEAEYLDGWTISWDESRPEGSGPVGRTIRSGKPLILTMATAPEFFLHWQSFAPCSRINSNLSIPFCVKGELRGVLLVASASSGAFEAETVSIFERLADEIGRGLNALEHERTLKIERMQREKVQAQLTEALASTIAAITATMERRDPYTVGHEDRVAQIAHQIGAELGWDEDRLQGLHFAAMVHDIGKISIPTEILTKPAKLSKAEYALIQEHPEIGYGILKNIPFPWPVADIVRQHHEHIDGSGYPLGLAGDAILPEARVLSVADIVESMSSVRPYRKALGLAIALDEIRVLSGKWLDPGVVEVCIRIFEEKGYCLPATR